MLDLSLTLLAVVLPLCRPMLPLLLHLGPLLAHCIRQLDLGAQRVVVATRPKRGLKRLLSSAHEGTLDQT